MTTSACASAPAIWAALAMARASARRGLPRTCPRAFAAARAVLVRWEITGRGRRMGAARTALRLSRGRRPGTASCAPSGRGILSQTQISRPIRSAIFVSTSPRFAPRKASSTCSSPSTERQNSPSSSCMRRWRAAPRGELTHGAATLVAEALAACWRIECGVAEEHDENQLYRISVPSGDHSPGDLALSPVHAQLS